VLLYILIINISTLISERMWRTIYKQVKSLMYKENLD
jgi:hypothetical protein